jgi:biopolymer transport protein TolR
MGMSAGQTGGRGSRGHRRRGRHHGMMSEINVTPFVDVMLVLLVIFMITAPMMNTGVDVDLPQVTAQQIDEEQGKLVLSIDKTRQLHLGKTPIKWAELQAKLGANERVQKEGELYVEADESLPYGVVVTAMALAKDAKAPNSETHPVRKVMLLTDPAEQMKIEDLDKPGGGGAASVTP